jgi:hypothetical protein
MDIVAGSLFGHPCVHGDTIVGYGFGATAAEEVVVLALPSRVREWGTDARYRAMWFGTSED